MPKGRSAGGADVSAEDLFGEDFFGEETEMEPVGFGVRNAFSNDIFNEGALLWLFSFHLLLLFGGGKGKGTR